MYFLKAVLKKPVGHFNISRNTTNNIQTKQLWRASFRCTHSTRFWKIALQKVPENS